MSTMGKPGLAIMIGMGKPKPRGNMADAAFSDYMKEKGKGGDNSGDDSEEGDEQSAAKKAGEEAASDFCDAYKQNDHAAMFEAFCRMDKAADEVNGTDDETAEDDGDAGE